MSKKKKHENGTKWKDQLEPQKTEKEWEINIESDQEGWHVPKNPSPWEAEAGGQWVSGHYGLWSKTIAPKLKKKDMEGVGRKGRRWGAGDRNDPNNVCTCEYMKKNLKKIWNQKRQEAENSNK
jgi:hypothetical protein